MADGTAVGSEDGSDVGKIDGADDGIADGTAVGPNDGLPDGATVGLEEDGIAKVMYESIFVLTIWKSASKMPIFFIPIAQLIPICPGSKLFTLSEINSPFKYRTSAFSHWSSDAK